MSVRVGVHFAKLSDETDISYESDARGDALTPLKRSRRCLLASVIPVRSMKKMKRAAQLSDDRTSCRGSNSACALARRRHRWARRSCATTS